MVDFSKINKRLVPPNFEFNLTQFICFAREKEASKNILKAEDLPFP